MVLHIALYCVKFIWGMFRKIQTIFFASVFVFLTLHYIAHEKFQLGAVFYLTKFVYHIPQVITL